MNEEIDDINVFLQDFTAVSDWEIFISRVEEVIHEWRLVHVKRKPPLPKDAFKKYSWKVSKENVQFGDEDFVLARYVLDTKEAESNVDVLEESVSVCQAMVDLSVSHNDFEQLESNCKNYIPQIGVWYGLREYLLLIPSDDINNESKIKTLLSSMCVAINNTGSEIPVFVQCRDVWQQFYLGVCETKEFSLKFDMIHLKKIPGQYHYLVGLLDLFKDKIASSISLDTVQISAKFMYAIIDWSSSEWMQQPPDFDFLQGKTFGIDKFSTLPFGAISDPVKSLTLTVSWLKLSEDAVVDSQSYSDFDPLVAPYWSMRLDAIDNTNVILCEYFTSFIELSSDNSSIKDLLDEISFVDLNSKIPIVRSSLDSGSKILGEPYLQHTDSSSYLTREMTKTILTFLFTETKNDVEQPTIEETSPFYISPESLKAGLPCDLVWRLAVSGTHVAQALGGAAALAHIWYEFCQEVRARWENATTIPGIMDGFPNSRTCLLHQKLQMLNVCIDRRKARDEAAILSGSGDAEEHSESDEEFYECWEDREDSVTSKRKYAPWNRPVGRLGKFGNLKLLECGDPLYIPITQEPVPKTEDQLEQDADIMLKLGTDANASEMIARIMSASLLSDMESFKAANPGGVFDDFIRWYSPRDWIEDEELDEYGQKKGHLSARMLIPDNMWVDVWGSAKPVPARRQRRLFDDTKEAEKTLHFLESRSISQIIDLLLPSLTQAVVGKLAEECKKTPELPQLERHFDKVRTTAIKLTREKAETDKYKTLEKLIYTSEVTMALLNSLKLKFELNEILEDDIADFFRKLLVGEDATIPGGPQGMLGVRATKLYQDIKAGSRRDSTIPAPRDNKFPSPTEREFVLRVIARRPYPNSSPALQMMRAILGQEEFRILGAFTEDTVFA